MSKLNFRRVQHVSITRPRGSEEQTRRFYGEVLGLAEVPVPETLGHLELIWYGIGADELHLVAEDNPDNTNSGRHLCIEVDDLEALRRRLAEGAIPVRETTPIPGRPRFFCADPFGNGIEFTQIEEPR